MEARLAGRGESRGRRDCNIQREKRLRCSLLSKGVLDAACESIVVHCISRRALEHTIDDRVSGFATFFKIAFSVAVDAML